MSHPKVGERVVVRPLGPFAVQRAEFAYGQFLPPEGQVCVWDDFLHRRLLEGSISWAPCEEPAQGAEVNR